MMAGLDLDDIQGLIARGYGNLRAARYALLHVRDGAAARAWLDRTFDSINPAIEAVLCEVAEGDRQGSTNGCKLQSYKAVMSRYGHKIRSNRTRL